MPVNSLGFWRDRIAGLGLESDSETRFGQAVLTFADPDGMPIELVADSAVGDIPGWDSGPIPAEHAVRGVHSVTLWEADADLTDTILQGALGFTAIDEAGARTRYHITEPGIGARVDVLHLPDTPPASGGAGTVHHVAWRTADRDQQQAWQARVSARGLHVTDILDRQYFTSIYFREPGGVLFEIATDPPGFTRDEAPDELGTALRLPPWFERQRAAIERALPPIRLPGKAGARG